jgi:hypothetical protein
MKVKKKFLSLGKFDLGNESQVRFWEDSWIKSRPLKSLFPTLYNIVRKKCTCKIIDVYDTVKRSHQEISDRC